MFKKTSRRISAELKWALEQVILPNMASHRVLEKMASLKQARQILYLIGNTK